MRSPEKVLLLVLALCASSVAVAQGWKALVSPAPLSPAHKQLEERCDACHLVFSGVPNEKCLACHKWIKQRQRAGEGFHAKVKRQSCQECHVDHQGETGAHTSKESLSAFTHDDTLFALEGAHEKATCKSCHKKPARQMSVRCTTCHEDSHDGELGKNTCARCHTAVGWKKNLKTVAQHETPADTGGHKGLDCTDCHKNGRQLSAAELSTKAGKCVNCHQADSRHGDIKLDCATCHQVQAFKPAEHNHDGCTCQFPGKHQTFECLGCHKAFDFSNTPTRCSGCHAKERTHGPLGECSRCHTALDWKDNRFDHNGKRSKFLLENKHLEVACVQCHEDKDKRGRTLFRAAKTDCMSCHKDTGELAHGDFGDCAQCHATVGFDQTSFDHLQATGFPITGRHTKIGCQDCHANKVDGYPAGGAAGEKAGGKTGFFTPRPVPGVRLASLGWWLPQKLSHGDPSALVVTDAALAAGTHGTANAPAGEAIACAHCHEDQHNGEVGTACVDCHTTDDWVPSTFTVERHAAAAFALDGKHTAVECGLCHISGKLKGQPTECAGCHVDRHQGKLGQSCKDCHTTSAFTPVENFQHELTGFELTTQHENVGCADCHGEERERDLSDVKGTFSCQACHTAGHASFDLDCVTCHLPEDRKLGAASGTSGFDHRDTGFALKRSHGVLPCKSCHEAGQPNPVPRCVSCHTSTHGGAASRSCTMCHQPDRWSLVRFNHDRTGWTLRGRHFLTPCTSCHTNQSWVGLRTECFDCHALDAARARATVGGHAFGRTDCRDCHRSGWQW